jgi:hypothetical protein
LNSLLLHSLGDNNITDKGVEALCKVLAQTKLEKI